MALYHSQDAFLRAALALKRIIQARMLAQSGPMIIRKHSRA